MASSERLPSGRYRGVAYPRPGQKVYTKGGTFKYERDAVMAAQKLEVEGFTAAPTARRGQDPAQADIEWGVWWDRIKASRVTASDWDITVASLVKKHVRPRWGSVPLNDIERQDIQDWVDSKLEEGYKINTVKGMLCPLSVSLTLAVEKKILSISPATKIRFPKTPKRQKDYRPRSEMRAMGKAMHADDRDAILFLGETGLRPSELSGLHADQIRGKFLVVRTVYVLGKKLMRDCPKDGDERTIPLTPAALEIAGRRLAKVKGNTTCGIPHHEDGPCVSNLLFRNHKTGGPLTHPRIRTIIRCAARDAKLPQRGGGYALRRAVATYLGRSGMDIFRIMEIFGWSDPEMARGYIQESPGAREELTRAMAMADSADG